MIARASCDEFILRRMIRMFVPLKIRGGILNMEKVGRLTFLFVLIPAFVSGNYVAAFAQERDLSSKISLLSEIHKKGEQAIAKLQSQINSLPTIKMQKALEPIYADIGSKAGQAAAHTQESCLLPIYDPYEKREAEEKCKRDNEARVRETYQRYFDAPESKTIILYKKMEYFPKGKYESTAEYEGRIEGEVKKDAEKKKMLEIEIRALRAEKDDKIHKIKSQIEGRAVDGLIRLTEYDADNQRQKVCCLQLLVGSKNYSNGEFVGSFLIDRKVAARVFSNRNTYPVKVHVGVNLDDRVILRANKIELVCEGNAFSVGFLSWLPAEFILD